MGKTKKGRVKRRFFCWCPQCRHVQLFKAWGWLWDLAAARCRVCGGALADATPSQRKASASRFPARRRKVKGWYAEYLTGELWKGIRERVLGRDGWACAACGSTATVVHHTSYGQAVLEGHGDSALVSLCGPCHRLIEFEGTAKNGLRRANEKLRELLSLKGGEA